MLNWSSRFNICCFLDNNQYQLSYHFQECLLAVGATTTFLPDSNFFSSLELFYYSNNDWIFGHFSYDLKNRIETLESNHPDTVNFPEAFLFVPEMVIQLKDDSVTIGLMTDEHTQIFNQINKTDLFTSGITEGLFRPRISKDRYISIIDKLRNHIKTGDCYEINFCQEFYSKETEIDPVAVYKNLSTLSPSPFACFYKIEDKYVLCTSPERYLQKSGDTIISQPIKGTAQRDHDNFQSDNWHRNSLADSKKDRSENVMIVDLVRNDLSKVCIEGSVEVVNLFDVYTFPHVHQLISTIKGTLKTDVGFSDILRATFPMGSMTGAPKKKVMQLIERYEQTKRGIYSGTIGYITPQKDFDFNVVIRSLMYNSSKKYLSYQVGSGIIYDSDPEKEYNECLFKAAAINSVLRLKQPH